MSAAEFHEARKALGLTQTGMAEALRLGANGARAVRRWEAGQTPISGPVSLAVEYLLRRIEAQRGETPSRLDAAGTKAGSRPESIGDINRKE